MSTAPTSKPTFVDTMQNNISSHCCPILDFTLFPRKCLFGNGQFLYDMGSHRKSIQTEPEVICRTGVFLSFFKQWMGLTVKCCGGLGFNYKQRPVTASFAKTIKAHAWGKCMAAFYSLRYTQHRMSSLWEFLSFSSLRQNTHARYRTLGLIQKQSIHMQSCVKPACKQIHAVHKE